LNEDNIETKLTGAQAILFPGGFGEDGIEGKILAITFARTRKIPFLGICLGMQLAIIEIAKNLCHLEDASSSEFGSCKNPVIGLMTEWFRGDIKEIRKENDNLGGTMRLGSYECQIIPNCLTEQIYGKSEIRERHRHRYEFNINYKKNFEDVGLIFSGLSPDKSLAEIVELKDHPWFIAVQFHPELKSRPFAPHPLFKSFVKASLDYSERIKNGN
jgi:CTP synthase